MKYYCENCGVEFVYPDSRGRIQTCAECIVVKTESHILKEIPVYETVALWEERKGRKYPDTAPVYERFCSFDIDNRIELRGWKLKSYRKALRYEIASCLLVATEAGEPPNDWRPE